MKAILFPLALERCAAWFRERIAAGALGSLAALAPPPDRHPESDTGEQAADLRLTDGTSEVTLLAIGRGLVRLEIQVSGNGRVTSSTGLDCGSTCEGLFDITDTVTLQATTTNGSNAFFSGWSEELCAGPARTCSSWSVATGTARTGGFSLTNQDFWSRAEGDCSVARDLYCVER